jgi:hypothetical protein
MTDEYYGLRLPKMTDAELITEAEEWADGYGEQGMSGDRRAMDVANLLTVLAQRLEAKK